MSFTTDFVLGSAGAISSVFNGVSDVMGDMYEHGGKGFEQGVELFAAAAFCTAALGIASKFSPSGIKGTLFTLGAGVTAFMGAGEITRGLHNVYRNPDPKPAANNKPNTLTPCR